jgi:hypothetical protein
MQYAPIDGTVDDGGNLDIIDPDLDIEYDVRDDEVSEYQEFIKSVTDFHAKYNSLKVEIIGAENELVDIDDTCEKLAKILMELKNENSESKLHEIIEQYKIDFKIDEKKGNLEKMREARALMTKVQAKLRWKCPTTFRCFVCLENVVDTFLDPCGHTVCSKCWEKHTHARQIYKCPGCRAVVNNARRLFFLA